MLQENRISSQRLCIICSAVFVFLSFDSSSAEVRKNSFVEHFDSALSHDIWSANAQDISRIEIVGNTTRAGSGAVKLTVFPEDVSAKKNRAEINIVYGHNPETENWQDAWYSWSILVPEDYYDDYKNRRFQIMGQFHVVPDFENGEGWEDYPEVPPMISFRYGYDEGGTGLGLFYGINTNSKEVLMITKRYIQKGKWYDITMHIGWSMSEEGFVEAWLNNEPLTPWNGKDYRFYGANMYNAVPPMLKLGLYRDWGFETINSVYYDELRIGHSREEVRITQ